MNDPALFASEAAHLEAQDILKSVTKLVIEVNEDAGLHWLINNNYSKAHYRGLVNKDSNYACCGRQMPHIDIYAPTKYLATLKLAHGIIDAMRAHCEVQGGDTHFESSATLDVLEGKIKERYPTDIISDMGKMLFENDPDASVWYPIRDTKRELYLSFLNAKPRHDCTCCNHTEYRVVVKESMNKAYKSMAKRVLHVCASERDCVDNDPEQREYYDRKVYEWKAQIDRLPKADKD